MKLDRLMSGVFAAAAVALACGCSSSVTAPKAAVAPDATATTNLMSAEIPGPAPKVGKAHLAVDEEMDSDAPKASFTGRHSDGSRRGGGFGTVK